MAKHAHLTGWGKALPEAILTNDDMAKIVDTNDEWIREHTGIRQRHIAGPDETAGTLSVEASKQALRRAGLSAKNLDLVIVATSSPDYQLPGAAFYVQGELGATRAAAFDLKAGCSGFIYALSVASQFIENGAYENVLVVGAEVVSICLNWRDRRTSVLFGDGAGAAILQARDEPGGLLSFAMGADGTQLEALVVKGAGSKYPMCPALHGSERRYLELDGRQLLRFALRDGLKGLLSVIEGSGLSVSDVDLFVPSQSNQRLIEKFCEVTGIPLERTMVNIDKYANTSAASVPIALAEALDQGRAKLGDNILLFAYGAGLSWAGAMLQMGTFVEKPLLVHWPMLNRVRHQLDKAKIMLRTASSVVAANAPSFLLPLFSKGGKDK